jgi:hypothetical protein
MCNISDYHSDSEFEIGDRVIIAVKEYDDKTKRVYGLIMDDYNLVVFDCGWVQENTDKIEKMQEVDGLYLCCGIGWKDLKHVSSAHLCLQSMTYTVVVNTEDEALLAKYNEELCRNCNEAVGVKFDNISRIGEIINS